MIPIEITQTPVSNVVYEQALNTTMQFGYLMLACGLVAGFAIGYSTYKVLWTRNGR